MVVKLQGRLGLVARRTNVYVHSVYPQYGYQYGVSGQVLRVDYSIYCASPGTYEVQVFAVGKGITRNGEAKRVVQLKQGYNAFSEYLTFNPDSLLAKYAVSVIVWKPGPLGQVSAPVAIKKVDWQVRVQISPEIIEREKQRYEQWKKSVEAKEAERIAGEHQRYVEYQTTVRISNELKRADSYDSWYKRIMNTYGADKRPDIEDAMKKLRDAIRKGDFNAADGIRKTIEDMLKNFEQRAKDAWERAKQKVEDVKNELKRKWQEFKDKLTHDTQFDVKNEQDVQSIRDLLSQLVENYRAFIGAYKRRDDSVWNELQHLAEREKELMAVAAKYAVGTVLGGIGGVATAPELVAKKKERDEQLANVDIRINECRGYAENIKGIITQLHDKLTPQVKNDPTEYLTGLPKFKGSVRTSVNNIFGSTFTHSLLITDIDDGILDNKILEEAIDKAVECRNKITSATFPTDVDTAWSAFAEGPVRERIHDVLDRRAGWFKW